MALPNRDNPYSFEKFLRRRDSFDYYRDDDFLQRLIRHHVGESWEAIHNRLLEFSQLVSFRWRGLTETNSLPEVRPWLMHYDGHGNRIDRIVRPRETEILEREVFGAGIFSAKTPRWERLAKQLLLHQNGEHGVMCALACTEGLIALVEEYIGTVDPSVERAWRHCKEGIDGHFGMGSQFLTEVQGGSDVPSNLLEAEPHGDHYRLFGVKFFCSACHTDYAIVTAKVIGSEDVSTFLVPTWLPGEKERERRNGHVLRRLKRKLGTIELPTAEIEYEGAVAYSVGPLGQGVSNVVGHVLTLSRINVAIGSAASNIRAAREARMYAEFRTVFDKHIADYPLAAGQLIELEQTSQRTAAGLFQIYGELLSVGGRLTAGLPKDEDMDTRKRKFRLRILIMLQKIVTIRDSIDSLHLAMSIFAGHGVMECFSALPRLLRDAMINEQWEGPRNLLLNQIHHDLQRVSDWYPAAEFAVDILASGDSAPVAELERFIESDIFDRNPGPESIVEAKRWDEFAQELFHAYQNAALSSL